MLPCQSQHVASECVSPASQRRPCGAPLLISSDGAQALSHNNPLKLALFLTYSEETYKITCYKDVSKFKACLHTPHQDEWFYVLLVITFVLSLEAASHSSLSRPRARRIVGAQSEGPCH